MSSRLGEGSYSIVSKIKRNDVWVADKMYTENDVSDDKSNFSLDFIREFSCLKVMSHPNIVSITDFHVPKDDDEYPHIFLPLASDTLRSYINNNSLSFHQFIDWVKDLLSGLNYIHQCGIIHRDIKPDNILINSSPKRTSHDTSLIYCDFGLSRFGIQGSVDNKHTDIVQSTPYRAPEIRINEIQDNPVAYNSYIDIWSLGIMLCHILCPATMNMFIRHIPDAEEFINFWMLQERVKTWCFNDNDPIYYYPSKGRYANSEWKKRLLENDIPKAIYNLKGGSEEEKTNTTSLFVFMINNMLRLNPKDRLSAKNLYTMWNFNTNKTYIEGTIPIYPHEYCLDEWKSLNIKYETFSKMANDFRKSILKIKRMHNLTPLLATHLVSRVLAKKDIHTYELKTLFLACYMLCNKLSEVFYIDIVHWDIFNYNLDHQVYDFESYIIKNYDLGYPFILDLNEKDKWDELWSRFMDKDNHFNKPLTELINV